MEFQNVTFQYPGAEEPALAGVSFVAGPGEVTAIIGGTGSGKSTLAGLIPRFYDVNRGRVLVDGVDVRDMPQADLRARIGFVPQKAVLFSGTIAENIRYGTRGRVGRGRAPRGRRWRRRSSSSTRCRTASPRRSRRAAPTCRAGRSSGSRSRARSSAGPKSTCSTTASRRSTSRPTRGCARRCKRETANATVFIVSQRIGTVIDADRIIVLDNGRVAGIGTHAELLKTSDVYREIVASQVSLEEVA